MKLKNFFNSQRKTEVVQELKKDFMPILEKVTTPVTTYAKENPRRTFALMIMIVIINMIILVFFTYAFKTKKGMGITDLKFQDFKSGGIKAAAPEITV